jgi:hypothetical protein
MIFLKDFFAKFLLTNFSSWLMVIFIVLFVVALICLFIASRFDDPLGNGNKISMAFGYLGIVAGVLASVLFIILLVVESVVTFVFLIKSQIAFPEFAIRLLSVAFISFLLVYLLVRTD